MNQTRQKEENWDLIIKPQSSLFSLNLKEIIQSKDLIEMFVKRDVITLYKQTILGPVWYLIQPALTTIMFMFIFGNIAQIPTDGIPQPLFYMAGVICWTYFSECLTRTSETFLTNQAIFGKVYFPRLAVPISITIANLLKFFIQLLLFIGIYVYYGIKGNSVAPNLYGFLFPLLVLLLAGQGLGFGILISSMTTKYRDLKFLVSFGVQLWMYITPIAYPLSEVKARFAEYSWIVSLNPVSPIIEAFRYGMFGAGDFTWASLAYSTIFTVVLLLSGIMIFNKVERGFMDVV